MVTKRELGNQKKVVGVDLRSTLFVFYDVGGVLSEAKNPTNSIKYLCVGFLIPPLNSAIGRIESIKA
jgi:hypothetical protein